MSQATEQIARQFAAAGLNKKTWGDILFNVKVYGAEGDGTTDDTAAIQAAINAAKAVNGIVFFPPGTYLITDTLNGNGLLSSDYTGVSFIGANLQAVTIKYPSFATKKAAIKYQGGSGALAGIVVKGITFVGSTTSVGIECNSQDGISIEECRFDTNARGILFSNDIGGGFTEFCIARRCDFTYKCTTAIEYFRGVGNDSFHGTGLMECTINTPFTISPMVIIGVGCKPYSAPMDFRGWNNSPITNVLIQNNSAVQSLFHGTITVENQCVIAGGTAIQHMGFVISATSVTLGTIIVQNKLTIQGVEAGSGNGVVTQFYKPYRKSFNMVPNANNTEAVAIYGSAIIYVTLQAANYDYRYLLSVTHEGTGGAGFAIILATIRTFNTAAYGAPTFTVNANGVLVITNATFPANGVTAVLNVNPVAYGGFLW